jgi:hypothetical protein
MKVNEGNEKIQQQERKSIIEMKSIRTVELCWNDGIGG